MPRSLPSDWAVILEYSDAIVSVDMLLTVRSVSAVSIYFLKTRSANQAYSHAQDGLKSMQSGKKESTYV